MQTIGRQERELGLRRGNLTLPYQEQNVLAAASSGVSRQLEQFSFPFTNDLDHWMVKAKSAGANRKDQRKRMGVKSEPARTFAVSGCACVGGALSDVAVDSGNVSSGA